MGQKGAKRVWTAENREGAVMELKQETAGFSRPHYVWYAIRTRSNYEKVAARVLEAKRFEPYLPLYRVRKRWCDRVVENTIPLFRGYVFCRFDERRRSAILNTAGVVSIVSFAGRPAVISDSEIEAIRAVLSSGRPAEPCPYLSEGQLIRVNRGPLRGLEGILIENLNSRMVISIQMLRRSLAVQIDPDCITPIRPENNRAA